jgi:DNA topoisomerase IA
VRVRCGEEQTGYSAAGRGVYRVFEVFADLFDYGYTNTMEAELDKIEYAVNGDSGIDEIYENLCGKTLEDIKSRLTIKNIKS